MFQRFLARTQTPMGQLISVSSTFLLGILMTFTVGFAWSWIVFLLFILFTLRYLLTGTVPAASVQLQAGDFNGAIKTLGYTWKPQWLQFTLKPMYYYFFGVIAMQQKKYSEAEVQIKKAIEMGLPADDNLASAYIQLVQIYIYQKRRQDAKRYISMAKKLNPKAPELRKFLQQAETAIEQGRM